MQIYCQEVNIIMFHSNTRLKIISYYCGMNSNFEKCISFLQQENENLEVKS